MLAVIHPSLCGFGGKDGYESITFFPGSPLSRKFAQKKTFPLKEPAGEPAGLYVHVPFCRTRCPYCDFYSQTSLERIQDWIRSLQREAEHYSNSFQAFDTLYLGGGTPSLLSPQQLADLFTVLRTAFSFAPFAEITLEANPDDITREKLTAWRDLGVNRMSVGVQSFRQEEIEFLQRRHTAQGAIRALETIGAAGFDNLSVDLIYGLPGQTLSQWLLSLKLALQFRPEHLSCYQLTVEEGTPFGGLRERGMLNLPDEDAQGRFFLTTSRFLEKEGYLHYEISNFARSEALISRHNSKYWKHVDYLGLGPGAHSFFQGKRWWNVGSVQRYCAFLNEGKLPVEGEEWLTEDQLLLETLYFGFRTKRGMDLPLLEGDPHMKSCAAELEKSGLALRRDGRLIPTRRGFLLADSLPLRMVR